MQNENDTNLQEIELQDGTKLFIEVNKLGGIREVGGLEALPFEKITSTLSSISNSISDSIKRSNPDKAVIELGLECAIQNGELIALIAKGSSKTNIKVIMEWHRHPEKA